MFKTAKYRNTQIRQIPPWANPGRRSVPCEPRQVLRLGLFHYSTSNRTHIHHSSLHQLVWFREFQLDECKQLPIHLIFKCCTPKLSQLGLGEAGSRKGTESGLANPTSCFTGQCHCKMHANMTLCLCCLVVNTFIFHLSCVSKYIDLHLLTVYWLIMTFCTCVQEIWVHL